MLKPLENFTIFSLYMLLSNSILLGRFKFPSVRFFLIYFKPSQSIEKLFFSFFSDFLPFMLLLNFKAWIYYIILTSNLLYEYFIKERRVKARRGRLLLDPGI
jgi:hypothetical protein